MNDSLPKVEDLLESLPDSIDFHHYGSDQSQVEPAEESSNLSFPKIKAF